MDVSQTTKKQRVLHRKDWLLLGSLYVLLAVILICRLRFEYLFGSEKDWSQQHFAFAEYFRALFYQTHDPFPSFAANIGGGQNIFNFSYYGLYNPVVLISYLLPFVPMVYYIIGVSIALIAVGTTLVYYWLRRNGFTMSICFFAAALYMLAGPVIFQSHRQIMFVSYLPFLVLALIGTDLYAEKKRAGLLITGVAGTILVSYFYAPGCLACVALYAAYRYLDKTQTLSLRALTKAAARYFLRLGAGVMLTGILILPTFKALLGGKSMDANDAYGLKLSSLFDGNGLIDAMYSAYGIGFTFIVVLALFGNLFAAKRARTAISAVLLCMIACPLFSFLFNGMLYARPKSLIPLLPLVLYMTAVYLRHIYDIGLRRNLASAATGLAVMMVSLTRSYHLFSNLISGAGFSLPQAFILALTDILVTTAAVCVCLRIKKRMAVILPVTVMCLLACVVVNKTEEYPKLTDWNAYMHNGASQAAEQAVADSGGFARISDNVNTLYSVNQIYTQGDYRTTLYSSVHDEDYSDLYYNLMNNEITYNNSVLLNATRNPLFNLLAGNRYLLTDTAPPIGYREIGQYGITKLCVNDDAMPVGFVTDKLLSESALRALDYPANAEALVKTCVVKNGGAATFESAVKAYPGTTSVESTQNLTYAENNGTWSISASENAAMQVKLSEPVAGKILFVRFQMQYREPSDSSWIEINGIRNKLSSESAPYPNNNYTFDFAVSANEPFDTLNVLFSQSSFVITDITLQTLDYAEISGVSKTVDAFEIDADKTAGDRIAGKINVTRNGYFVLSMPYDKGFTLKVNGKKTPYEMVDGAFIGFPVTPGEKDIELTYKAPWQNAGIIVSALGAALCVAFRLTEKKK
ncbi:MAG: YfhO family protein [Oscillospiraceae bacterium]